jgi:hypothetical protein
MTDWRIPLSPSGFGIVTPGCDDRSEVLHIAYEAGVGLRVGSDARLCFDCGPDGGVYHPDQSDMATIRSKVAADTYQRREYPP